MRLTALLVCLVSLTTRADVVLVDRIVAVVDTYAITRSAVDLRARTMVGLARTGTKPEFLHREALVELIEEFLIVRDADRLHLELDDTEVDRALEAIAEQNKLTLEQLTAETKRQGLDFPTYRRMLRQKIIEMKWVNAKLDRAGLAAASADPAAFIARERRRLVVDLRNAAAIEVRL